MGKLSSLVLDPSCQPREALNHERIAEYADLMRDGVQFPSVVAFGTKTKAFLADGWHRYHAAQEAGLTEIGVDYRNGKLPDAQWHAASANATHGLARTNGDKRRAVTMALKLKPNLSNAELARHTGVTKVTVARVRQELEEGAEIPVVTEREYTRAGQQRRATIVPVPKPGDSGHVRPLRSGKDLPPDEAAPGALDVGAELTGGGPPIDPVKALAVIDTFIRKVDGIDQKDMARRIYALGHPTSAVLWVGTWFTDLAALVGEIEQEKRDADTSG